MKNSHVMCMFFYLLIFFYNCVFCSTTWLYKDDHRYLEVRTQLLSGLLANTQRSPLISEGLLFNKSLELCDNMLYEHKARQRILTETHMSTVEV